MPRPNKRKLHTSKLSRKQGRFVSQEMTLDMDMTQDLPQDGIAEEEMPQIEPMKEVTITQEKANEVKKAPYTGMSRTTVWRKKQKVKTSLNVEASPDLSHLFPAANIVNRLQSPQPSSAVLLANALSLVNLTRSSTLNPSIMPTPPQITTYNLRSPVEAKEKLEMRLKEINIQCKITKSSKANVPIYNHLRLLSISRYIKLLLDGWGKMDASIHLAQTIWGNGDSTAKRLRKWGNHYIETGELLFDRQGKHAKLKSLIKNKDFSDSCQAWLHQQKPESRSPGALKTYIEGTVFPQMSGQIKKNTISERTCRTYMHLWGFRYDENKKGVYYDGHERPDVVAYRKEWLKRMFTYKKSMKDFDGEMLEIVIEPQLEHGHKELVQVMIFFL